MPTSNPILRLSIFVLCALAATFFVPTATAQDGYVEQLQRAFEALGTRHGNVRRNPAYERFQRNKSRYAGEVARATQEQDRATKSTATERDRVVALYRSRAQTRGDALDRYLYGRMLALVGELDRAAEEFNRALELDLFFFWAWDGLGVYYVNRQMLPSAIKCFEKVLTIEPNYLKSTVGLTQCYARTGQHRKASLKLEELLKRGDVRRDREGLIELTLLLADVYRGMKDWPRCIETLSGLLNGGYEDTRVRALRALGYVGLEQWHDAANDYGILASRTTGEQRSRYLLRKGTCLVRLGRNHEAADLFDAGLKDSKSMQFDERTRLRRQVIQLRKRKAIEDPKKERPTLDDWIKRLKTSTEPKRRREAMMVLASAPRTLPPERRKIVNRAIMEALLIDDTFVQARAVQEIGKRFRAAEPIVDIVLSMVRDERRDPLVRATAAHVLRDWDTPRAVPYLIKAIASDDDYLFSSAHDALNDLTRAWVERILPEHVTKRDRARVRKKWDVWYRANRDRYRRYEPK